jgi:ubiquinone/menaquinone biosynthesis C-methylase UbiE
MEVNSMEKVISYYSSFDEWGRLDREPLEFQVNFYHIINNLPANGNILDNGAGPGKYSIELAKCGYHITLTDLTPKLVDIAMQKAEEQELLNQFRGFYTADARDLSQFSNNQFDAALMLGPLYHLQTEEDRNKTGRTCFCCFYVKDKIFNNLSYVPRIMETESYSPRNYRFFRYRNV